MPTVDSNDDGSSPNNTNQEIIFHSTPIRDRGIEGNRNQKNISDIQHEADLKIQSAECSFGNIFDESIESKLGATPESDQIDTNGCVNNGKTPIDHVTPDSEEIPIGLELFDWEENKISYSGVLPLGSKNIENENFGRSLPRP
ncbi:hypothetical protein JTB14_008320 [Gonioctena quinquepunctata]|nr:hypothetical protein JTB14_008320 [Gonioctena quinquepunctata]